MSERTAGRPPRETGDRTGFLGRIAARQGPPPSNGPHPLPPGVGTPPMAYRSLDGVDPADPSQLLPVFLDALGAVDGTADVVDTRGIPAAVTRLVGAHGISRAVVTDEPEVVPIADALAAAGVEVAGYDPVTAEAADLGVTGASHAVAATGSVAVDTDATGSRAVSLLPRVHCCVVPIDRLVATPADVLRGQVAPMPSLRVLITGPSRTADIEQLLTLGAHGPVALHVLVVSG